VSDEPYNPVKAVVIDTIKAHIPSLSDEDEEAIHEKVVNYTFSRLKDDEDLADFAIRTCACGVRVDGFYQYADHLISIFGGESHFGG